jgi:hypothetical protein
MENELRYYLGIVKKSMEPVSEHEAKCMADGTAPPRKPFVPKYLITAVKLPNEAIEVAINTENIAAKIDYILEAYEDDMHLKTNTEIVMQNLMVV